MGLFRKSAKAVHVAPAAAPVVGPDDLVTAQRVTGGFIAALGNDPRMRQAAFAISQAGGGPRDFEASLEIHYRTGETGLERPWRWLAEVVDHPAAVGNHVLVAQTAFVVMYWHMELRGKLSIGDTSDMMLEVPDQALVTRIASATVHHLQSADGNVVLGEAPWGTVSLGMVRMLCADHVVKVQPPAPEAARKVARQVLGLQ